MVVGRWDESPYGAFADVMVETAAGHRVLLAPTQEVADFVASTYTFDEVRIEPLALNGWVLSSPSLSLELAVGQRAPASVGCCAWCRARLAESPAWCTVTDPVARVVLRGVRTRGTAGNGRREWYGATDVRAVTSVTGTFDGADLGTLAPVTPAPRVRVLLDPEPAVGHGGRHDRQGRTTRQVNDAWPRTRESG